MPHAMAHKRHTVMGLPAARGSGCKHSCGSILKYEAYLYIHTQLPSGGLVALRMKVADGQILRCHQNRRARSACGIQTYRGR